MTFRRLMTKEMKIHWAWQLLLSTAFCFTGCSGPTDSAAAAAAGTPAPVKAGAPVAPGAAPAAGAPAQGESTNTGLQELKKGDSGSY